MCLKEHTKRSIQSFQAGCVGGRAQTSDRSKEKAENRRDRTIGRKHQTTTTRRGLASQRPSDDGIEFNSEAERRGSFLVLSMVLDWRAMGFEVQALGNSQACNPKHMDWPSPSNTS